MEKQEQQSDGFLIIQREGLFRNVKFKDTEGGVLKMTVLDVLKKKFPEPQLPPVSTLLKCDPLRRFRGHRCSYSSNCLSNSGKQVVLNLLMLVIGKTSSSDTVLIATDSVIQGLLLFVASPIPQLHGRIFMHWWPVDWLPWTSVPEYVPLE